MAFIVTVTDIFTIVDGNPDAYNEVILTKNKHDIFVCISVNNSSVVEIWETSPTEAKRNIIFSTLYTNFSTPSGASATAIVTAINSLLIA